MPRNTQLVEIDLRGGILTNESPYVVGPRLWRATNSVFDYRYPRVAYTSARGPWMHRMPLTPQDLNQAGGLSVSYTGLKGSRDLAYSKGIAGGIAILGANTSNQYALWSATAGGAAISFAGGVARFTIQAALSIMGCSTYFQNPANDPNGGAALAAGTGALVFSHPEGDHVYYLLTSASAVRSLTSDVSNCPAGADALCVHLDRVWLGRSDGQTSKVYYTDPLNLDSIRSTNVVQVPDAVTCLVPGQFGAVDSSGVAHLVLGCATSVYVLDGDPQLGGGLQADLRCIASGTGIANSNAACVTPFGVFFLGHDGDCWWIPQGMQEIRSVGGPIRDRLGVDNVQTPPDLDQRQLDQVVWFDPYLYVFPGGEAKHAYIGEVSNQGIDRWWGPVVASTLWTVRQAIIKSPPQGWAIYAPSGKTVPSMHAADWKTNTPAYFTSMDTRTDPSVGNQQRSASVQTGLINVPGHRVQAMRVILETMKVPQVSAADVAWTVTVTDERGTSVTATRLPDPAPTAGTFAPAVIATQHFVIPPLAASRGISVTIAATATAELALQRAFVELHTTPAQF